jgi:hypothetical protein
MLGHPQRLEALMIIQTEALSPDDDILFDATFFFSS